MLAFLMKETTIAIITLNFKNFSFSLYKKSNFWLVPPGVLMQGGIYFSTPLQRGGLLQGGGLNAGGDLFFNLSLEEGGYYFSTPFFERENFLRVKICIISMLTCQPH